ncbi:unnamed protein product, partial [Cladocopium goreaui]
AILFSVRSSLRVSKPGMVLEVSVGAQVLQRDDQQSGQTERTRRVARDLLETHSHLFEHLQRLQQNNDNQHDHGVVGRVPPAVRSCELCGRAKHRVRWVYSTSGKGKRKPSGSSCFACWKTCVRLLRCSRSPRLLRESGAIGVVKDLSLKVQRDLGSEDVCTCASCRPTK